MSEEIVKVTIPQFNDLVRIAEKRSVLPFKKDSKKKIPKKYQTDEYSWNGKGYLIHTKTGVVVAANAIMQGKPRDWRINGQDIYNQKVKQSARNAVMVKIHNKFIRPLREVQPIDPEQFPLTLRINFYVRDYTKIKFEGKGRLKNIDNDNRWIYEKAVQDTMVELGILPDDNPKYINGNHKKTYFVETDEECRLEIILLKDDE